ncbi:MAG: hypothetical protein RMX89_27880, partial [Nostoc sp. DedSLP04]|nr:hypothetical protein [Nostoc sp. DedSLP04]
SKKAEVDTECAKHRNVLAEINSKKAEVDTECAKHRNVLAEVNSKKAIATIQRLDNFSERRSPLL